MPNTRSRKLTVVLAAGALTMFGAAGALAADQGPGGGDGGGGGGTNPLCATPLASMPICSSPGQQPPEGGGGSSPSARPLEHGGDHGGGGNNPNPLCAGTPLTGTPICGSPGQQPPDGGGGAGGGGTSPSARPMNHGAEHRPGANEGNPLCAPPMAGTPLCRADDEPDPPTEGPGADPSSPGDDDGSGSPS